jgi:threonine synthase
LAEDGVGCEPASAATVAGIRKLVRAGKIERHADIIAILTGHQLKDTDYVIRHRSAAEDSRQRIRVEANLNALRKALEDIQAVRA